MIVKVISNLKHNGTLHKAGDVFDLDEKYVDELKGIVEVVDGEKAPEENAPEEVNLENKKRDALDKIAKSVGIKNPEELPNRNAVIEAIEAEQVESAQDEGDE